jgi:DNA polymerase-3 subunit beta
VLPFTVKDDRRPVLRCVLFTAKEGKLHLISADGFRLAVVALDCEGEGQALIDYSDLQGMANALKRAKRARISFETRGELEVQDLVLETDLIRYKWTSINGSFPDWGPLIPSDPKTTCHLDTVEAVKAIGALKALADDKGYAVDLAIGEGKVTMANPDNRGQSEVNADIDGEAVSIRLNGGYLVQTLKACGGMVDMKITNANSPVLFTTNGYKLVMMPMATGEAAKSTEAKPDVVAQAEAVAQAVEPAKPPARRPKPKRKAREAVAVA